MKSKENAKLELSSINFGSLMNHYKYRTFMFFNRYLVRIEKVIKFLYKGKNKNIISSATRIHKFRIQMKVYSDDLYPQKHFDFGVDRTKGLKLLVLITKFNKSS